MNLGDLIADWMEDQGFLYSSDDNRKGVTWIIPANTKCQCTCCDGSGGMTLVINNRCVEIRRNINYVHHIDVLNGCDPELLEKLGDLVKEWPRI